MDKLITFSELSLPLKIGIAGGILIVLFWGLQFIIAFIEAVLEY